MKMNNFLSIHIPKTGGTIFLRYILRDIWPDAVHQDYDESKPLDHINSSWKVIHGHFKPSKYSALSWPTICWVRNPIDRALSEYAFLKRQADRRKIKPQYKSFDEFIDNNVNAITEAIENNDVDYFDFIGILEQFKKSMQRFGEFIGIDTSKYQSDKFVSFIRSAYTENRKNYESFGIDRLERFIKLNKRDYDFYLEALEHGTS